MITYKEHDAIGGWFIAVMRGHIEVGKIRRHGHSGGYVYFSGKNNQMNWSLHAENIDGLKRKIERSLLG